MKRLLVLVALLFALPALSATYYVDCNAPDDRAPGTSAANAWKTIDKVNRSSFIPGDSILFRRGCTWRETLVPASAGAAGRPITFGAYGGGAKPIINAADDILGLTWANAGTNHWQAIVTTQPQQVFFNSTRGTPVASVALVNGGKKWCWASNVLTVYSTSSPSTAFTSLEAGARDYCVYTSDKSYVTLDSLDCRYSNLDGIVFILSSAVRYGWIVGNCSVSFCFRKGIYATGNDTYNSSGFTCHDNSVSLCGGYTGGTGGLSSYNAICVGYADGFKIYNNTMDLPNLLGSGFEGGIVVKISGASDTGSAVYGNSVTGANPGTGQQSAMDFEGVSYVDIYNNQITANIKRGLWFDATGMDGLDGPTHCKIHHNRITLGAAGIIGMHIECSIGNAFWGNIIDSTNTTQTHQSVYVCRGSSSNLFYNNTIIAVGGGEAIKVGDAADPKGWDQSYCEFKNNIIYHSGALTSSLITVNDGNTPHVTTGIAFDYNNYIDPDWTSIISWFGTPYDSVAAWHTAQGQEAHYVSGDPLFTNAVGGDFTLQDDSPCIDAGADLGSPYNLALMPGSSWPNNVVNGDQDQEGRSWEIGAYLFRGSGTSTPTPTPTPNLPPSPTPTPVLTPTATPTPPTSPPEAPTGVSASDGTYSDRVRVIWNASAAATGYKVFRNASNSPGSAAQIGMAIANFYDDPSAVAGTAYFYWVVATNSMGGSSFSSPDTGYRAAGTSPTPTLTPTPTPIPPPPPGGVTPSFTFSPETPTQGTQVQFTDRSSGAAGWNWDFGDGTRSTLRHPAHTYAVRGIYTVVLWVSSGVNWSKAEQTITVGGAGRVRRHIPVDRVRPLRAPGE